MNNPMINKIRKIESGIGLGNLKFGMFQEEVKAIVGLPNYIEVHEDYLGSEHRSETWNYDDLELRIDFSSEDDWRMDTLAVNDDFYVLFDLIRIGQHMNEVEDKLKRLNLDDYICEDISTIESPDHKLFDLRESYINLWFDDRRLSEIQWGPKFVDENTIKWPHNNNGKNELADIGVKRYESDYLFEKLGSHLDEWLDLIFKETAKYEDLISDFPLSTTRENLRTGTRRIRYAIKMDEKVDGSIMAKARLIHNEHGDIGWMAVEWENDLTLLDDYLHID